MSTIIMIEILEVIKIAFAGLTALSALGIIGFIINEQYIKIENLSELIDIEEAKSE